MGIYVGRILKGEDPGDCRSCGRPNSRSPLTSRPRRRWASPCHLPSSPLPTRLLSNAPLWTRSPLNPESEGVTPRPSRRAICTACMRASPRARVDRADTRSSRRVVAVHMAMANADLHLLDVGFLARAGTARMPRRRSRRDRGDSAHHLSVGDQTTRKCRASFRLLGAAVLPEIRMCAVWVQFHSPQVVAEKKCEPNCRGSTPPICWARPCVALKRALIDRIPRLIPRPQQNPLGPGDCAPTQSPPSTPEAGTRHSRHARPFCRAQSCTARCPA